MTFKTVLLAIGAAVEDREIDRAAEIAAALDAHLSVLALDVAPPPPTSPYGVVSNDIWASEIREGQDAAQARGDGIAARLGPRGGSFSVHSQYLDRASISSLVARFARYADVALILPEAAGESLQGPVTNGALFESGRPVVLLPRAASRFPVVERVVIAWDASVEASKAVRDALGIMQRAKAVHAVLIDPVPSFDGHGPEPGADLATYLGRHGISTTVHRLPREGRDVSDILQRTATDLAADLIVMGGFGHSRLRQRIFGGTTKSTLRNTGFPVLMAH